MNAAVCMSKNGTLWNNLESPDLLHKVIALEPEQRRITANEDAIDNICQAFAEVIDAKSPFTYRHSSGVAEACMDIGRWFGMKPRDLKLLRRAALLHDLGKLSVPNMILEKPGKLTAEEWKVVKKHPYYTLEILRRIPGFEALGEEAAAHHEKLDGSGYWRGLVAEQLSTFARILAVADIFDALRPTALPRFHAARQNVCDPARGISSRAGLTVYRGVDCRENEFAALRSGTTGVHAGAGTTQKMEKRLMKLQLRLALVLAGCTFLASSVSRHLRKASFGIPGARGRSAGRHLRDVVGRCGDAWRQIPPASRP